MDKPKVGIIGVGIVGNALKEVLQDHYELVLYDKYKEPYKKCPDEMMECGCIFITVNTPMGIDGSIDLSAVEESVELATLESVDEANRRIIIIKSTATSGVTDSLNKKFGIEDEIEFVFNPEFLTAKTPLEDFRNTNRIILGTDSDKAFKTVRDIYLQCGFKCPIIKTTFKEAETVKYLSNCFLSAKVGLANEFYNICQKLDVDYDKVIELLLHDKRIGKSHWKVPNEGDFGFGGSCFPKDLNAFIATAKKVGYDAHILREIWRSNLVWRKNYDW